ncbi:MAG: peroxiredoxin [Opitutales bacterium]|nr:peroxiredoxin [Opitutales bacterium]
MKQFFMTIMIAGIFSSLVFGRGNPLEVGQDLPDLEGKDQDGQVFSLADSIPSHKTFVLVYFYPKADTPGCTAQACSLRDDFATLEEKGVKVIGVSGDTVAKQKAFADRHGLPFTLIADTEGVWMNAFGVPHRGSFASRQAFLFAEGKLVWRDLSASTSKQAADVLAFLANT